MLFGAVGVESTHEDAAENTRAIVAPYCSQGGPLRRAENALLVSFVRAVFKDIDRGCELVSY
jgi:hypothetical protein